MNEIIIIRVFKEVLDKYELVWHYDKKDRYITVISGKNWMFQLDNELPFELIEKNTIFVPKLTYHRLLKGNSDLVIRIKEI